MAFADVQAKTTITGFSAADQVVVLDTLRGIYDGSATAKAMIDAWLATAGHTIKIEFEADGFSGFLNAGRVKMDVARLANGSYIGNDGTAAPYTLRHGLAHELVHALTGRDDNWNNVDNYKGDTVVFTNTILTELGDPQRNSYIASDSRGTILFKNYKYTNGATIDRSEVGNSDWNSAPAGASKDLLIGGASANTLQGGPGNDFLVGNGGNDTLDGGADTDTVVLFGKPSDYDIRMNANGTWTSRHVRGAKNEGTDTLANLEKVQFKDAETYELKKNGLTFQTDFAIVVDQTGSMDDDIDAVKASTTAIINALFADDKIDARVGVVGFRDNTIGETTQVFLRFTDQDVFADRKAAVVAAINSLGASGGGDEPETAFDGLLKALNGDMGEWRQGAGVKRIALFTDASAKDASLLPTILSYAANIGGTALETASMTIGNAAALNRFEILIDAPAGSGGVDASTQGETITSAPLSPISVVPPGGKATVEIYTIFVDEFTTPDASLTRAAEESGGKLLTAADPEEVVSAIIDVITTGGEAPGFRLFAPDGFKGSIGGTGDIFGTNRFQDITLLNLRGDVGHDPSFNRGGDIIRLSGNAGTFKIALTGSTAVFDDGDSKFTVPVGTAGAPIVFADGVRKLVYDTVAARVKIGSQAVNATPTAITAPADGTPLPTGIVPGAEARIFLEEKAKVTLGGDFSVFGTNGLETLTWLFGDVRLDPSFNRGGDTLMLPDPPGAYSAYRLGSSVVLLSGGGEVTIPVGTAGMTLNFGGTPLSLRFDAPSATVKIGDFPITATDAGSAQVLGGGSILSLDVGDGGTAIDVTLAADKAYTLNDAATSNTNVVIHGFTSDDKIRVTGATADQYSFTSIDADKDGTADDMVITFSSGGVINILKILDVVDPADFITDYASAKAAVGFEFMTFA